MDDNNKIETILPTVPLPEKGMTPELLLRCIDSYANTIKDEKQINESLIHKKIRLSNFPSHISENIVKLAYNKKYGIMPNWDIKPGDLLCIDQNIRLEVKGFIDLSNGPPTFGPTENWDQIYFLDGLNNHEKKYKIYEIRLSNQSDKWKNLKISKTQTYLQQCQTGKRPRLSFKDIQAQLGDDCELMFDGHISELF